jgi:phage N-6-adenine-methyltransferase
MQPHPACAIFPLLEGDDLQRLADDISTNGLLEAVVVHNGTVLDGRNRLAACELAGVDPELRQWEGDETDILPWIVSRNLHRRHLNTSQRAMVAAKLATLRVGANQVSEGLPIGRAAELLSVGERTVHRAREVLEEGTPELVRQVEQGEVSVSAAAARVSDQPNYDGDSWSTPDDIIAAAREVLGDIDLDPATNPAAQERIRARLHYTLTDDGLSKRWSGRVWLNPPYSDPAPWVELLLEGYERGNVDAALVLVNSCTDTGWFQPLLERFPVCFVRGRIRFLYGGVQGGPARQPQCIVYLGRERARFAEQFGAFGVVVEAVV